MRINVRHETNYRYQAPARSALQLIRLTPRSCDNQFVRRWRVDVDAVAKLEKGEDAYGNLTHMVFVEGPVEELRIVVEGEVDTSDLGGFLRGAIERLPERFYLRVTPHTHPSPELREFAHDMSAGEGGDPLACLHRINAELHRLMAFDTAATTAETTAAEAFGARAGVCQDFAHVFIAAARTLGIPARYVSGYFLRSDINEQEAGHAWAEAHLAGLGWIGFDPAHGLCVTERYVRVAIGADGNEATPVRGAHVGGAGEELAVAVAVHEGRAIIEQ
jgi:transglutaminase-like putative cysteine protease